MALCAAAAGAPTGEPRAPCKSFDRAYQVAAPGDTVQVAAGTYGSQTVNKASGKAAGSARVTFQPAVGATPTLGSLTTFANAVTYKGLRLTGEAVVRDGTGVTIQVLGGQKPYVWGTASSAPRDVLFKGGVWVEQVSCSGGYPRPPGGRSGASPASAVGCGSRPAVRLGRGPPRAASYGS